MTLFRLFILFFAIQAKAAYQPVTTVSGSVSVTNFPSVYTVSGSLTPSGTQIVSSTGTVPISAASLPLPSGAATSAKQDTQITSLTNIYSGILDILSGIGTSGAAEPLYTQAIAGSDGVNLRNLKTDSSGELQVDVLTLPSVTLSGTPSVSVGTVAVTGPLTDAQLRATPVSVSAGTVAVTGNFYQATQPVSIASTIGVSAGQVTVLQGTSPWAVSAGTVAVTGPLTDAQLRASNIGVSATLGSALPTGSNTIGSIANTSFTATQGTATNLKTQAEAYQGGSAVGSANPLFVSLAGVSTTGVLLVSSTGVVPVSATIGNTVTVGTHAVTQSGGPWSVNFATPQSVSAGTVPVTGTFWQATQPVSAGTVAVTGPLTDAQLRASSVPVSATIGTALPTGTNSIGQVTANAGTNLNTSALNLETTQTAMSAKLPASLGAKTSANSFSVVPASDAIFSVSAGTVAITGALTDAQLRATAVPVSAGTVAITASAPLAISIGSVSTTGVLNVSSTGVVPVSATVTNTVITSGTSLVVPNAGSGNALSTADSQAFVPKLSIKSSSGRIYLLTGSTSSASPQQWIMVFNSAAQPATNTKPNFPPILVGPSQNFSFDFSPYGAYFSSGIYIANSTSATAYVNGTSDTWINVLYQ
jgi:hypothetical protein